MPERDLLAAYKSARSPADATLDDVWNCYRLYLGREPDPMGFSAYASVVRRGVSIDQLARWFSSCPEYALRMESPPNPTITRVALDAFDLYVPQADAVVGEPLIASGTYEPHVTAAISEVLRGGQTVIDVGASVGYFTLLASTMVGETGAVIAFEPLPRNVKLLFANTRINEANNVIIHPYGASDKEGLIALLSTGSIASSREARLEDAVTINGYELAYARTIDSIVPEATVVDVIKIDIDGFDYRAVLGAGQTLSRTHPHVFAEFAPGHLAQFSEIDPLDYLRLYQQLGYNDFTVLRADGVRSSLANDIDAIGGMPAEGGLSHVDLHIQRR